ncbi:phosphoenolpyruvate--protein phosphotransferase protein (plasmid) [Rhizobium etli 8C-3]|uniref:Phosphoenolpyruvate--protein phosphotransferase protein n=2 Tax=Rhizobium TaxID=379 RepID=A0A1L5PFF1_RHIET|nr:MULTISPECIES: putative PEP-binding protein [Rhizobium]APO78918.1 phosphoenolpyruvate--protein phosphotransferase protein [Rhizobium etli 8C-3]TCU28892.1 phosphoenolpyruvate--protein phosphotransferase [Rhizobium azibense]
MAERDSLKATSASSGVAYGPAHLAEMPVAAPSSLQPASGYQALIDAIEASVGELEALAARSDAESRDIIDFQIEVLRDPTIAETAEARMDAGENIVFAWAGTLDDYIGELETADEEQVRARAVDILDIKNRVLCALAGAPIADFPAGSIFVARDMEPSRFLAHDWSQGGGIALFNGSAIGHVALLARAKSIPMVVNTGHFNVTEGDDIRVDADSGAITIHADGAGAESASTKLISMFTDASPCDNGEVRTADGTKILLSINVNDPADLDSVEPVTTAGVGLMRSEFAVSSVAEAASEEKQIVIYRHVLKWAAGKPVTIRMLDIGGDKPLAGLSVPPGGPATDLRGIRLLLAHPEIARVQARALLRAAVHGDLRVTLPMVTFPSEINEMRSIFREEAERLSSRGMPHPIPPIGMMVEVPAAALMLDTFETADFFSLGTNDLTQQLAASTRDGANSMTFHRAAIPALFRFLEGAMRLAAKGGKPVSICGNIAGDPQWLPGLLAIGLRHFSVAPVQLPAIRSAIVGLRADGTKAAGD